MRASASNKPVMTPERAARKVTIEATFQRGAPKAKAASRRLPGTNRNTAFPPFGAFGNVKRNSLEGPAFCNVNLALVRDVRLGTSARLQVRVEAFNVFNHVNWGNPNVTLGAGTSGQVTSTANDPRIMQFALKVDF